MIHALIIDDEPKSRNILKGYVSDYCEQVNIIGEASSAYEGSQKIAQLNPDLVFLDIQMPGGSGFDLLSTLDEISFEVIFTTAFDQYAVKAFKFSAVDYLLKPINILELQSAVKRVIHRKETSKGQQQLTHLKDNLQTGLFNKIALPTLEGLFFVEVQQILRCESDGAYTKVFLLEEKKFMVSRNLKEFEALLTPHSFFRVHHSHLINLNYIVRYQKGKGGMVELEDGTWVNVSVRKKDKFLEVLSGM